MKGCQIDLLIQTERMALVVEIKRCKKIEHDVIQEVREKVASLEVSRELSVRTALVYDGILSPSVEADRYFDFILPFEKLLYGGSRSGEMPSQMGTMRDPADR